MKEDYQKALKKLISFFLSNPVPFNKQIYLKQKGSGTSDQSLFSLPNKFGKMTLLVIYYLTKFDDIIERCFWVIPKITSTNLWKPIHGIINYSTSISPFESEKCGKEGKKRQKFEYVENEKSFLDDIKIFFIDFEGLSFGEKIKIW